jgi:hypothetical protein
MRALEAHRHLPAFAGAQRLADKFLTIAVALIPGQHDARRHHGSCGRHRFNGKFETATLAEILRQRGNDADQFDVAPFPGGRQGIGKANLGPPGCPRKTKRQARQNADQATQPPTPPNDRRQRQEQPAE